MYLVTTSNFDKPCQFATLSGAIGFISDQAKMGFSCTIEVKSPEDIRNDPRTHQGVYIVTGNGAALTVPTQKA